MLVLGGEHAARETPTPRSPIPVRGPAWLYAAGNAGLALWSALDATGQAKPSVAAFLLRVSYLFFVFLFSDHW